MKWLLCLGHTPPLQFKKAVPEHFIERKLPPLVVTTSYLLRQYKISPGYRHNLYSVEGFYLLHTYICKFTLCAVTREYSQRNSKSDVLVVSVVSYQFYSRPHFTLSSLTTTHFISHSDCTLILLDFAAQVCLLVCIITPQKLICKL